MRKLKQNIAINLLFFIRLFQLRFYLSVMLENIKKDTKPVLICLLINQVSLENHKIFRSSCLVVKKKVHMAWPRCCETPSQVRDGIKKHIILNENGCLSSPLLLLEFEKSSLWRWLCSKDILMHINAICIIMHGFFFVLLSSKPRLSKNKSKLCSPSVNKTQNYRSMWDHKGINNSFQEIAFGTQFGTPTGVPVSRKRY